MKSFSIRLEHKSSRVLFPDTLHSYDTLNNGSGLARNGSPSALLVFDENTQSLFPPTQYPYYVLPAGEQFKNSDSLLKLAEWALSLGASRETTFIAVGGGVVCDITAFLASMYMRGGPVILVPTTLLAMVDAALGGKTGIDFQGYKNILGSFHPAEEIRVFPEVLQSLPESEYLSGLGEVIKHALLRDSELLELLQNRKSDIDRRDPKVLEEIIFKSQLVKQWYIEQDPYDQDIRGHLNLGHTFAHALESISGFSEWSHGQAVAWGIGRAMHLGLVLGLTSQEYADQVSALLHMYGYRLNPVPQDAELLLSAMQKDKKKKDGQVRFILQSGHGCTSYQTASSEAVLQSLRT
ncbi:MAG: 3-dehydroquinate synthase [Spirochaetaceae bacterium]|nr:3-dehydroquinate synthase [Spirochaetaceae bacterium]MCF7948683.1 3-dehydroquinate synthase [Spirochaetia bacterium]MCF7951707.1 3-dehydroquinate synthase [Spirochaetaceae bacterium]